MIRLATRLQPDDVAERLSAAIDGPFVPFGKRPVIGTASDRGAVLRKRLRGRNSFQSVLRARLLPDAGGTILECRLGMHPAVVVFTLFWLGAVVLIGGSIFVAGIADVMGSARSEIPVAIALLGPPAMLAFGLVLFAVGRGMARGEDAFLTQFLIQTLEARPLAATATGGTVS